MTTLNMLLAYNNLQINETLMRYLLILLVGKIQSCIYKTCHN